MKKLQAKVKRFCRKYNLNSPVEHRVLDTMSELGEVAKEVLLMSDYGRRPFKYRKEIKEEIGDLFFSLITIANFFNVNLEEALNMVLEKYKRRLKSSRVRVS
jgi:NTP pyrophosphatase (non-canonical NTP hydrolase)